MDREAHVIAPVAARGCGNQVAGQTYATGSGGYKYRLDTIGTKVPTHCTGSRHGLHGLQVGKVGGGIR